MKTFAVVCVDVIKRGILCSLVDKASQSVEVNDRLYFTLHCLQRLHPQPQA